MSEQTRRDALAEALRGHKADGFEVDSLEHPTFEQYRCTCGQRFGRKDFAPRTQKRMPLAFTTPGPADLTEHIADALLPLIATWEAEAWDAGYDEGRHNEARYGAGYPEPQPVNPFRTATDEEGA